MSQPLGELYHWSSSIRRKNIRKRGLRPTTPTAVWMRPDRPGEIIGHGFVDLPEESILAVCLGTTPLTAWALSGAHSAERGDVWDLWQVLPDDEDEVHYRPHFGTSLDEVRIANLIQPGRLWFVGSRLVGHRRMIADHSAAVHAGEILIPKGG